MACGKSIETGTKVRITGVDSSIHVKRCLRISEQDGLARKGRTSSRILKNTSAIFEVEDTTDADLPAPIAVDVLDIMEHNVNETKRSVVVIVKASIGSG